MPSHPELFLPSQASPEEDIPLIKSCDCPDGAQTSGLLGGLMSVNSPNHPAASPCNWEGSVPTACSSTLGTGGDTETYTGHKSRVLFSTVRCVLGRHFSQVTLLSRSQTLICQMQRLEMMLLLMCPPTLTVIILELCLLGKHRKLLWMMTVCIGCVVIECPVSSKSRGKTDCLYHSHLL